MTPEIRRRGSVRLFGRSGKATLPLAVIPAAYGQEKDQADYQPDHPPHLGRQQRRTQFLVRLAEVEPDLILLGLVLLGHNKGLPHPPDIIHCHERPPGALIREPPQTPCRIRVLAGTGAALRSHRAGLAEGNGLLVRAFAAVVPRLMTLADTTEPGTGGPTGP